MMKQINPLSKIVPGLFFILNPISSFAQNPSEKEDIELNRDAVKMIQFDFNPSLPENKPREAPLNKTWMEFKTDIGVPKDFLDTIAVKKPKNFIRLLPYSIWTCFGEDPVYDVLVFKREKELEMTFHLGGAVCQEEYGKSIAPSTGEIYNQVASPLGSGAAIQGLDINKFLTDNLTRRGRMLRRNRKHANAWKTYKDYSPTKEDSLKLPTFYRRSIPPVILRQDSVSLAHDSIPTKAKAEQSPSQTKEHTDHSNWLQYIRQKVHEDSIQKQSVSRKKQLRENVYDVDRQIKRLKELQN